MQREWTEEQVLLHFLDNFDSLRRMGSGGCLHIPQSLSTPPGTPPMTCLPQVHAEVPGLLQWCERLMDTDEGVCGHDDQAPGGCELRTLMQPAPWSQDRSYIWAWS